ncbi:unnamed protein product [Rotaria socialis]|uniref:Uncharacterized protein n=1 Tax=Rotaria socialis TaxID=392032 RepID=A0A821DIB3_9BILA|nr:unnamed protein product [Rotaria socialis]CAF4621360.1 unnamed protein product [Rotaria socialis]
MEPNGMGNPDTPNPHQQAHRQSDLMDKNQSPGGRELGMHQFQFESIQFLELVGIGWNWNYSGIGLELVGIGWNWNYSGIGLELVGIGWNWNYSGICLELEEIGLKPV